MLEMYCRIAMNRCLKHNDVSNLRSLNKIKFATGEATFLRAMELYEVTQVEEAFGDFTAVVKGSWPGTIFCFRDAFH